MSHQEKLIAWLNDAHAMETSVAQVLEAHAKEAKDHPLMQTRMQEHLEETRRHADLVKGCIERLGSSPSTIKSGMGTVMGTVQGMSTALAKDKLVKNALADYASEHFEIASYQALVTAALQIGDQQTATVCQDILRDEDQMARWLEQQLPVIVQETIGEAAEAHA
ncbi:MAG TPA: ferritin-like domain-containing protein [Thermomicrobiales bacterium]|nr:ferritin-like domain-containing protein [Thermomicrobiales bacterium]